MLNSVVMAIIVFVSVLGTPKIIRLKEKWQTMLATAIVAVVLVVVWEAVKPI